MTTLNDQFNELSKVALKERNKHCRQQEQHATRSNGRISKKPRFFHDNNNFDKPERKYTTSRIKSRNFLSNISYVGVNKDDF